MLYQELPRIDSSPLDGWGRWLMPALVAGAALTGAVLLLLIAQPVAAGALALLGAGGAAATYVRGRPSAPIAEPLAAGPDYSLVGSALAMCPDPAALTTGEGSLLIVNSAYRTRFEGARPPLDLAADEEGRQGLAIAQGMAWRDGAGCVLRQQGAAVFGCDLTRMAEHPLLRTDHAGPVLDSRQGRGVAELRRGARQQSRLRALSGLSRKQDAGSSLG